MVCPRCGGKIGVLDSVHNTEENETYRKRKCEDCELVFYTEEHEIRADQLFRSKWYRYHRNYI